MFTKCTSNSPLQWQTCTSSSQTMKFSLKSLTKLNMMGHNPLKSKAISAGVSRKLRKKMTKRTKKVRTKRRKKKRMQRKKKKRKKKLATLTV